MECLKTGPELGGWCLFLSKEKKKKPLGGKWGTSFEIIILINAVGYRQLGVCVYCTTAGSFSGVDVCFTPLLEYWKKHDRNKCPSGERCLFMRMEHGLQVADSDAFGVEAKLVHVSEPSCGGIREAWGCPSRDKVSISNSNYCLKYCWKQWLYVVPHYSWFLK